MKPPIVLLRRSTRARDAHQRLSDMSIESVQSRLRKGRRLDKTGSAMAEEACTLYNAELVVLLHDSNEPQR